MKKTLHRMGLDTAGDWVALALLPALALVLAIAARAWFYGFTW